MAVCRLGPAKTGGSTKPSLLTWPRCDRANASEYSDVQTGSSVPASDRIGPESAQFASSRTQRIDETFLRSLTRCPANPTMECNASVGPPQLSVDACLARNNFARIRCPNGLKRSYLSLFVAWEYGQYQTGSAWFPRSRMVARSDSTYS